MAPNYISKRAAEEEAAVKKVINTIYNPNKGLFENLLRLAPYVGPFFGIPWWQVIAAAIGTHALGLNPSVFGKKLDDAIGTSSGQIMPTLSELLSKLKEYLNTLTDDNRFKEATHNVAITKEAGILSSLLRGGKVIPKFIKGVAKLIGGLLAFYGVATIDDLIRSITGGIREKVPDVLNTGRQTEPTAAPISTRDKTNDIDTMVEKLKEKYHLNKE